MKMFAVAGRPILHSKSPLVFAKLFQRCASQAAYGRVSADSASGLIDLARRLGLEGLNITSPLKQRLLSSLDDVDEEALRIGAVNTIVRREGRFMGFNTDPYGVLQPLLSQGIDLCHKRILVLGAGGAARAALAAVGPFTTDLTVVNRTRDRAESCARTFGGLARPWRDLKACLRETDILINTIPSAAEAVPARWLPKGAVVLNASYKDSAFNDLAAQRGCRVIPGEWWLYHQALKSFSFFMGCSVPTLKMDSRLFSPPYRPLKLSRVALVGFMGSGKTAVGRLLASRSGLGFVDTDDIISRAEGFSIRDIFSRQGEAAFRAKEKDVIRKLAKEKGIVMACGGGAVLDEGSRQVLKKRALVIWLCASPQTILSRVRNESRPLLEGNDVQKKIGQLLSIRQPDYFKTADLIVDADRDAEEVARNIHEEINSAISS